MQQTEAATHPAGRPRPWLIAILGVALAIWLLRGKPVELAPTSALLRVPAAKTGQPLDPSDLYVKLEALARVGPRVKGGQRHPFQFYVPPPRPPVVAVPLEPLQPPQPVPPLGPAEPPSPPPIMLKFIGLLEGVPGEGNVAAFSDCRATMRGREGDIIDGRYRLVRIGIESVVMEYPDGRGRTTIRKSGQECVAR